MSDELATAAGGSGGASTRFVPACAVGLGDRGSTARQLVELVGEARVRGGLDIVCVPTSEATAAQARGLGIPLTTLDAERPSSI